MPAKKNTLVKTGDGKAFYEAFRLSGKTAKDVYSAMGISNGTLYNLFNAHSIDADTKQSAAEALGKKEGDIFGDVSNTESTTREPAAGFNRNARMLGLPVDVHTPKSGISYVELSEGYYMMYAPHVTIRARAGFQGGGYADPVYVESLPKYPMIVNTVHKGNYFVFDIGGDSMDDGSIRSIPDSSKVLGREIKLDLWRSRFHYNEYPYFVIVTATDDGLLCKEIIAHDVEKGIIRVRSLNPNKKMYPDFDIHLNDCHMICNIVKKELPANV